MRNIFKNILCRIRPGAQLNIAFGAVLFIPVFVTTLFSVTYYSQKIKQEAAAKIASELKIAEMIFQESVS